MTTLNTHLYEFPLNDRMRTFIKLEEMFSQLSYHALQSTSWDHQHCLTTLIKIINLTEKVDVKAEVVKETERNINLLNNLSKSTSSINIQTLHTTLEQLNRHLTEIKPTPAKFTQMAQQDDLLSSMRQRLTVSTSFNRYELPALYYWSHQPQTTKEAYLNTWMEQFHPMQHSIKYLMQLIRDSAYFEIKTAQAGFYQKSLNPQQNCQIIRIKLPQNNRCFPELSANKHRINLRFLEYAKNNPRPQQTRSSFEFDFACCDF